MANQQNNQQDNSRERGALLPREASGYLVFERPIAELESRLTELRHISEKGDSANIDNEIRDLEKKLDKLRQTVYANLGPWQTTQLARHPDRPYTLDYIDAIFTDFEELHGDRQFSDDRAIVAGIAWFESTPIAVVGHQKGRDTKEKLLRNFGMPKPEGYRKARRLFEMAERFGLPVLSFIDTPGAYPGIDAEERGQSEAIATNLKIMSQLKTPIISTIIGEGGSGGALALGVADHILMLQYSIYSVISPEGCAAILWKDAGKAEAAASALKITSRNLAELGLIDQVVEEPLGGAHHDFPRFCSRLRKALSDQLVRLRTIDVETLLEVRYRRLMGAGSFHAG